MYIRDASFILESLLLCFINYILFNCFTKLKICKNNEKFCKLCEIFPG